MDRIFSALGLVIPVLGDVRKKVSAEEFVTLVKKNIKIFLDVDTLIKFFTYSSILSKLLLILGLSF